MHTTARSRPPPSSRRAKRASSRLGRTTRLAVGFPTWKARRTVWQAGHEIERIMMSLADGVTVQDANGRVIWANEAAARSCHASSPAELLATPIHEVFARFDLIDEHGLPFDLSRLPSRLALQGQSPPEVLLCS